MLTEKIDPKEQIQKEDIKKSKTLIIYLNSYLKTKNNPERINILVEIYQELQKGSRTPDLIDIEELEFIQRRHFRRIILCFRRFRRYVFRRNDTIKNCKFHQNTWRRT